MPRIHTRRLGARRYADFSASALKAAATDVSSGMSYRKAEEKHGVPKDTIRREVLGLQRKPFGRPPVLSPEEEDEIARLLSTVGDWGYPLDSTDLKLFIKQYLDRSGRTEKRFKNNLPGADWCYSFLKRRKELTQRLCQNIKRSRAAISNTVIESYFTELEKTMDGIPPENIINYDKSNLTDDPGVTKVIAKKGSKRISRILDHSKSSTSFMMSVTASGIALPIYVVYRAIHLYDTWCEGGPDGCRYNRSKSGWFESTSFEDWFEKIPLRYFKGCDGKKCIIGDNLSSHLSANIVKLCEENNISFVFIPPNATHLLQPLDVSFFGPLKRAWKKNLEEWKLKRAQGKGICIPKDEFPRELKRLMTSLEENMTANIKAGFKKTGIFPFSKEIVLKELPIDKATDTSVPDVQGNLNVALIAFLKEHRFKSSDKEEAKKKKKRLSVPSGRSVKSADLVSSDSDSPDDEDIPDELVSSDEDIAQGSDSPDDTNMIIEDAPAETPCWMGINHFTPDCNTDEQFLLVKFFMNNGKSRFYLGKALGVAQGSSDGHGQCEVKFLRPYQTTSNTFVWPGAADITTVDLQQIVGIAEKPTVLRRGQLKFNVDSREWK